MYLNRNQNYGEMHIEWCVCTYACVDMCVAGLKQIHQTLLIIGASFTWLKN